MVDVFLELILDKGRVQILPDRFVQIGIYILGLAFDTGRNYGNLV